MSLASEKSWLQEMEQLFESRTNNAREFVIWTGVTGAAKFDKAFRVNASKELLNSGLQSGKVPLSDFPRLTEMIESEDYESYELANSIIEQKLKE